MKVFLSHSSERRYARQSGIGSRYELAHCGLFSVGFDGEHERWKCAGSLLEAEGIFRSLRVGGIMSVN